MDEFVPTGLGKTIFQDRYARTPEETWEQACRRVATHVAQAEENGNINKYGDRFFHQLSTNKFNPGGRIWYGSGRPKAQLANCFVIGTHDSREGWGKTTSDVIVISGMMGGVGMNMSPIRPRGSVVKGTGGYATGAVSLMELINDVGNVIVGGGGRRMALMLCLNVNHPDIEEFLEVKLDLKKLNNANVSVVIPSDMSTETFVSAVENDQEIELVFNGIPSGKTINAKKFWDKLVENAWTSGEPGVLNSYLANQMNSISYHAPVIATNPCFRGDTLIATADGRNAVPIRQLAEEGKDVPVYSMNHKGEVEIKWGRNPRLTRKRADIVEVVLDSGNSLFVTPDHKFILRNGTEKKAKDLVKGDSLPRFTKTVDKMTRNNKSQSYFRINVDVLDANKRIFEHKLIAKFYDSERWHTAYEQSRSNGWHEGGIVVHHKDFNGMNNAPDNLEIMTFKGHQEYHANVANFAGARNPMWGKTQSSETRALISQYQKDMWQKEDYRQKMRESRNNKKTLNAYSEGGKKGRDLSLKAYYLEQEVITDLRTVWLDDRLYAIKSCEVCTEDFTVKWARREQAYCSRSCLNKSYNHRSSQVATMATRNLQYRKRLLDQQVSNYLDLLVEFGREPKRKEWEDYCKKNNTPYRFRPDKVDEGALGSFAKLKEVASNYNHRVSCVRIAQSEDVYNITVDDNHTVAVITEIDNDGSHKGIYTRQCGEQWMEEYGVCTLGALVLPRFVSEDGSFNWDEFDESVRLGVRYLDDIIDINHYPLPEIKENCENVRRIGLGVMGLHTMLLEMGMKYDSENAFTFVDRLFNVLKNTAYDASINLAIEKGPFPAYDSQFLNCGFAKTLKRGIRNKIREHGIRNCALMTVAPTGTTSLVSGVSSAIEPLPPAVYWRNYYKPTETGERVLAKELVVEEAYYKYPDLVQSAVDISVESHFRMQQVVQKHVDNAVSKTINMDKDFPLDAFGDIWLKYLPYLKGTTVYRYGSRENEPINPVPRDQWDKVVDMEQKSDSMSVEEFMALDCASGSCEINLDTPRQPESAEV